MRNKAIILDLDGVVVDSPEQKLPSKKLVKIVRQLQKDYYICAATGRAWSFGKDIIRTLKLKDPCVINAGTQIVDPVSGKIVWQVNIDDSQVKKVIEILSEQTKYKLIYNDVTEDEYFYGGVYPKDFNTNEPINILNYIFIPDELAKDIAMRLNQLEGVVCIMAVAQKPGMRDLHITSSQATKEQAVAKLLKMIKVEKINTIGVGDGHNDINLFRAAERKIAMGNAVKELKSAADEVIGDIKDDGLVGFLEKL